jgi:hypothetical protein
MLLSAYMILTVNGIMVGKTKGSVEGVVGNIGHVRYSLVPRLRKWLPGPRNP